MHAKDCWWRVREKKAERGFRPDQRSMVHGRLRGGGNSGWFSAEVCATRTHFGRESLLLLQNMLHARSVEAGSPGIWKGDILVSDVEELKNLDTSEIHARRLNAMEVFMPHQGENFVFPCADGTIVLVGKGGEVRKSIAAQYFPDSGEAHLDDSHEEADAHTTKLVSNLT